MIRTPHPASFSLSGGHPALDLVNTLDDRFDIEVQELLPDYPALLRFTEQEGLLEPGQLRALCSQVAKGDGERAVGSARELREAAARVLYAEVEGSAPPPVDVSALERLFNEARRHQVLRWSQATGEPKFSWVWESSEPAAELPVWILSLATAELLTSSALNHVRSCDSESCRWLFLDTSKNHSRRWCDMKVCGNRMKARRFLERSGVR